MKKSIFGFAVAAIIVMTSLVSCEKEAIKPESGNPLMEQTIGGELNNAGAAWMDKCYTSPMNTGGNCEHLCPVPVIINGHEFNDYVFCYTCNCPKAAAITEPLYSSSDWTHSKVKYYQADDLIYQFHTDSVGLWERPHIDGAVASGTYEIVFEKVGFDTVIIAGVEYK